MRSEEVGMQQKYSQEYKMIGWVLVAKANHRSLVEMPKRSANNATFF